MNKKANIGNGKEKLFLKLPKKDLSIKNKTDNIRKRLLFKAPSNYKGSKGKTEINTDNILFKLQQLDNEDQLITLKEITKNEPSNYLALSMLGQALNKQNKADMTIQLLEKHIKYDVYLFATYIDALLKDAHYFEDGVLKQDKEKIQKCEKLLNTYSVYFQFNNDIIVKTLKSKFLYIIKKTDTALEELLNTKSTDLIQERTKAHICLNNGFYDAVVSILEEGPYSTDFLQDPYAIHLLTKAYGKLGQAELGIKILSNFHFEDILNDRKLLFTLAELYSMNNQKEKALDIAKHHSLAKYPPAISLITKLQSFLVSNSQ